MKKVIRLTEEDLLRIVKRTINEMEEDESLGEIDKGEERLKELIEISRDFLELSCDYTIDELNEMSEFDLVEAIRDNCWEQNEGEGQLLRVADEMEELLNKEGF